MTWGAAAYLIMLCVVIPVLAILALTHNRHDNVDSETINVDFSRWDAGVIELHHSRYTKVILGRPTGCDGGLLGITFTALSVDDDSTIQGVLCCSSRIEVGKSCYRENH